MRGYKGMNKDMTCRDMQYEVGKSYHIDGDIEICNKGFHFCKNLNDVFKYYNFPESRFFEIEASGKISTERDKSVTSDIVILQELTELEVNRGFYYGIGHGNSIGHDNGVGTGHGYGNGNGYGYNSFSANGSILDDGNGYGDGYRYSYEINGVLI